MRRSYPARIRAAGHTYNLEVSPFAAASAIPTAGAFGPTLGRLFLRTLPGQYDEKSVCVQRR